MKDQKLENCICYLKELGGYYSVLGNAIEIYAKKSEDYNNESAVEDYFPFGNISYLQLIHMKYMRIMSVAKSNSKPNYESLEDSLLDMINYCSFFVSYTQNLKGANEKSNARQILTEGKVDHITEKFLNKYLPK